MRNQRVLIHLICFTLLLISLQFSVFGQEKWLKVKTKNFTLVGNADEKQIRRVGTKIEQFREAMIRIVPEFRRASPVSTNIIVFKDNKSFHPFKPINAKGEITEWVTGFFQSGIDKNYISFSVGQNEQLTYQTIFHEYVHYLIDNNIGRSNLPTWFNEGIAEYYDQISIKKDKVVTIGNVNKPHLQYLRKNKFIPFKKFLDIDYKTLRVQNQSFAKHYYSQSWAFMHFLMSDESRKLKLNEFINSIPTNKQSKKTLQDQFRMNYFEFENSLEQYISSKRLKTKKFKFEQKLTQDMRIESYSIDNAEAYAYLGDLLNLRDQLKLAQKYLAKSLDENPDSSLANSSMGLLKLKQKKGHESEKYLKKAINAKENDYSAYYRYAHFLSREGMQFGEVIGGYSDEKTKLMRELIRKSISLNPDFSENYRLLGFINLVRNENLDEGIKLVEKALKLSPGRESFLLNLADLHFRNKDFGSSKQIAQNVLDITEDEGFKAHAQSTLKKIKRTLELIERAKLEKEKTKFKGENSSLLTKSDSSGETTEEELERNRTKTLNEAIAEVLRKPKEEEKRLVGVLKSVKCKNGKIYYQVYNNEKEITFYSKDFRGLFLRAYRMDMGNFDIDCGLENINATGVITYKTNKKKSIFGDLIAIEFVPDDFAISLENQD